MNMNQFEFTQIRPLNPKTRIFIEDSFDSAHFLPNVPEGHQCRRMHGHTYRIRIEVEGPVGKESGWIMDYSSLKPIWISVKSDLDHHTLNDVLPNPTCERLAQLIWNRMNDPILGLGGVLVRMEVRETERCGVVLAW